MKTAFPSCSHLMGVAGLVAALAVAVPVQAQELATAVPASAGSRIGFVNTDRLFSESTAAQNAQNKLKQEFSAREKQLIAEGDAVKQAVQQYEKNASGMTDVQRKEKERQLIGMDAEFQRKRREFQEDLNNRKNEELQQLLDKANKVVVKIAKDGNYDVILQEAVYVNKRLDITDQVIEALNAGK